MYSPGQMIRVMCNEYGRPAYTSYGYQVFPGQVLAVTENGYMIRVDHSRGFVVTETTSSFILPRSLHEFDC